MKPGAAIDDPKRYRIRGYAARYMGLIMGVVATNIARWEEFKNRSPKKREAIERKRLKRRKTSNNRRNYDDAWYKKLVTHIHRHGLYDGENWLEPTTE